MFTPQGYDYSLDTIELAAGIDVNMGGAVNNILYVWLMNDSNGEPGSTIESFSIINQMINNGPAGNTIVSSSSSFNPILNAGSTYWIKAATPFGTNVFWNTNDIGAIGTCATKWQGITMKTGM